MEITPGDLACPTCGAEVIVRHGGRPYAGWPWVPMYLCSRIICGWVGNFPRRLAVQR